VVYAQVRLVILFGDVLLAITELGRVMALVISHLLVRVAVGLLPFQEQERFRREWAAEADAELQLSGNWASLVFSAQLILAATRMTLEIRASSETGFAEWSIAMLASVFPASILFGLALYHGVWIMVFGELALIIGLFLMASGAWSHDGGLLDSRRSRAGILLAAIGSAVEIIVRRTTGFGPAIDDSASATIPHAVILIGLLLFVASHYLGRHRRHVQIAAVAMFGPGAASNGVVVLINGVSLSGFDRFGVLMYLIPSIAFTWAGYSIAKRPQVFEDRASLEV